MKHRSYLWVKRRLAGWLCRENALSVMSGQQASLHMYVQYIRCSEVSFLTHDDRRWQQRCRVLPPSVSCCLLLWMMLHSRTTLLHRSEKPFTVLSSRCLQPAS